MSADVALELNTRLPGWARFLVYPEEFGLDLSVNLDKEKWIILTVPNRVGVSLLLSLGQLIRTVSSSSSGHRLYGVEDIQKIKAGELITWLDAGQQNLNYGRMIDSLFRSGRYIKYENLLERRNTTPVLRTHEDAMRFRFDGYFGPHAKEAKPLAPRSKAAENLYNLTNIDLQCRSSSNCHIVGSVAQLETEVQQDVFVDGELSSLKDLLRPDRASDTGHYLSRWSSVNEEDESISENSPMTVFDGGSAFFRNRSVSSQVNVIVVDRWENRAFGIVDEFIQSAAMYGGFKRVALKGLPIEVAMYERAR